MNQKGFAHILAIGGIVALVAGLGVGVYLAQQETDITPEAEEFSQPSRTITATDALVPNIPFLPPELLAQLMQIISQINPPSPTPEPIPVETPTPTQSGPTPTTAPTLTPTTTQSQPTPTSAPTSIPTPTSTPVPTLSTTLTPSPTSTSGVCPTPPTCSSNQTLIHGDPPPGSNTCPSYACVPISSPTPVPISLEGHYRVSFDANFNTLIDTGDGGVFGGGNEKTINVTLPASAGQKSVYIQFYENGSWTPAVPVVASINLIIAAADVNISSDVDSDGDGDPDSADCGPNDNRAKHGQTQYFDTSFTHKNGQSSFDFNCDGVETKTWGQTTLPAPGCYTSLPAGGSGYVGAVAACGQSAPYRLCNSNSNAQCTGTNCGSGTGCPAACGGFTPQAWKIVDWTPGLMKQSCK